MNKYILVIVSLFFFSCSTVKNIHYGDKSGDLCYTIIYNKKLEVKSLDGVEYYVYQFHLDNEFLYITSDSGIPGENHGNMINIINNDSISLYEFAYNNKLPPIIEGKDENGYYYNYTDTIINIGYSNVKSEKSKKYFDYIIKHLKKCENR